MTYEIASTAEFSKWFKGLKNRETRNRILARLARVENGNFGDFKKLDEKLFEIRFFFGSGYRIYYTIQCGRVVLLLRGGDKSTQKADIKLARQLLTELENQP